MKKIMKRTHIFLQFLLIFCLPISSAQAAIAVKVFSLDEGMSESNISKPRIYIQNTGTETITDFTYRFYFTTENGKSPMLEDYYTPTEQIMLVPCGSGYYIQYTITGANLTPGGLLPHSSGNSVGLHYNDWSAWDKTNDFSDNLSSSFAENQNIAVYVSGTRIYGNEPSGISGSVLREVWTGVSGTSTDLIPVSTTPQVSGPLSSLDEPRQYGDNFGSRLRGYITAPASGNYTFWIASDDDSKLFLSTNEDTANKGTPIAWVTNGYTDYLQWNKYASQKSATRTLVAGSKYFIEVLHKDGTQNDNCTVGWLKPGQSGSVPSEIVPSSVLTPFVPPIIPTAPTGLTATAISSQSINLSWTDASNNEFGFRIEMAIGSGAFSEFVVVAANQTSYQVTGLTAETLYKFRVRAYNIIGNSDYSNTAQALTFAVPAGSATRELWVGVTGTQVSDIPVTAPPYEISPIYQLEMPQQAGDYYGRRIRGYIIPPTTGSYTFWIASDDCSQLWLSTNDQAASKALIASVSGYTGYREWNKYTSQKSAVKTLTAGLRYYFEILQKENNLNDNLSVGWLKPGQSGSVPSEIVPGSVLAPFIIPSIPAAPSGLAATALSATQIDLTWTDNSNNEDGFRIERSVGGGPFVEVGTATANALVYHDAGLTALTQYQYRIRGYNGLGNSGYSNIAVAITLEQSPSVPSTVELSSFAVYSTEKTTLKDHCYFNGGGAVGSNGLVETYPQSIVNGNVISGGNITLKSQAIVNGNVTAAGTVTLESGATVNNGTIEQGATVAIIDIPSIATIPTGSQVITVNSGENRNLLPGNYNALTVTTNGTLTLSPGLYTFTSFFLQPDAHVVLNCASLSDMIDIQIAGDLEFSDRSTVLFNSTGYVPFIRFYTNDNNTVRIGCDVQFTGILSAPNGNIAMYSRARCNGALYGKTITVEPDAVIASDMVDPDKDSDGDHVPNILEVVMGTDPNNPNSFIPIAVPSKAMIDNTQDDSVTYDFSVFYPEYAAAKAMKAKFPANSLTRSYIPLIITVNNTPSSGTVFSDTGRKVLGRYINFRPENGIVATKSVTLQTPQIPTATPEDFDPYLYFGGSWSAVTTVTESDEISKTAAYFAPASPIVVTGLKKSGTKTLYFDDGYVYSNRGEAVFRYNVEIPKYDADVKKITVRIDYIDYSTNPSGDAKTHSVDCDVETNVDKGGTVFYANNQFFCAGGMNIVTTKLTFTRNDNTTYESMYDCSNNFYISPGQALILISKAIASRYSTTSSEDLMALYFDKSTESFESASFGDGRIVFNTTSPISYEYFLKDYLGSTRMVINEAGDVTEATMYQPYGAMSAVGSFTPAIPVKEKFTGKEFDKEGGTGSGSDGIEAYFFGGRYYDPDIGVWYSVDPAQQFFNPYSYAGMSSSGWTNPLLFKDFNGNFGPIYHWFLGGWDDAMCDAKSGEKNANRHYFAHGFLLDLDPNPTEKTLEYFLSTSKEEILKMKGLPSDYFTDDEWDGIRQHAFQDYYHHYDPIVTSPLEALFPGNSRWNSARAIYEDAREASFGVLAGSGITSLFVPVPGWIVIPATVLAVDELVSMIFFDIFLYPQYLHMRYDISKTPMTVKGYRIENKYSTTMTDRATKEKKDINDLGRTIGH